MHLAAATAAALSATRGLLLFYPTLCVSNLLFCCSVARCNPSVAAAAADASGDAAVIRCSHAARLAAEKQATEDAVRAAEAAAAAADASGDAAAVAAAQKAQADAEAKAVEVGSRCGSSSQGGARRDGSGGS